MTTETFMKIVLVFAGLLLTAMIGIMIYGCITGYYA